MGEAWRGRWSPPSSQAGAQSRLKPGLNDYGKPFEPGLCAGFYQLDNFSDIRESAQLLLGENELASVFDLEYPARGLNEFGLDAQLIFQLLRQTSGFRFVASRSAVGNLTELHGFRHLRKELIRNGSIIQGGRLSCKMTSLTPQSTDRINNCDQILY
jgi:hypothetical protein